MALSACVERVHVARKDTVILNVRLVARAKSMQ